MKKKSFQSALIPEGWRDASDCSEACVADEYLEREGLYLVDVLIYSSDRVWTLLKCGGDYIFYNSDAEAFTRVMEPRNLADILEVLSDDDFDVLLHLDNVKSPHHENPTVLERVGWSQADLRRTCKPALSLVRHHGFHNSDTQSQANDETLAPGSELHAPDKITNCTPGQGLLGCNKEPTSDKGTMGSYGLLSVAKKTLDTDRMALSTATHISIPKELLPAGWLQWEPYLALASRSFPYKEYNLHTATPVLVQYGSPNYLMSAEDSFYLYNQPLQDIVRIDKPTDLSQVLVGLNDPCLFQVTALRKPINQMVAARFGLNSDNSLIPCGWHDNIRGCEEVLQVFKPAKFGLLQARPLLVRMDGLEVLLECNELFYIQRRWDTCVCRVNYPKDLGCILRALEGPSTVEVSALLRPVPNDLVPEEWSNDYDGSGPIPLKIRDNVLPEVTLAHPRTSVYLLDTVELGLVLWKEGTNYITEFEEPQGLLIILPLLNRPQSLKTRKCAFPRSFMLKVFDDITDKLGTYEGEHESNDDAEVESEAESDESLVLVAKETSPVSRERGSVMKLLERTGKSFIALGHILLRADELETLGSTEQSCS